MKTNKIVSLILLALVPFFAAASQDAESGPPRNDDLPRYAFDLRIAPENGTISGTVRIALPADAGTPDRVYIALGLNLESGPNPRLHPALNPTGPHGYETSSAELSGLRVNGSRLPVTYYEAPTPLVRTINEDRYLVEIPLDPAAAQNIIEFDYAARLPEHATAADDYFYDGRLVSRFSWFPKLVWGERLDVDRLRPFAFEATIALEAEDPDWLLVAQGGDFDASAAASAGVYRVRSIAPVVSFPLVLVNDYRILETRFGAENKTLRVYTEPGREDAARLIASYAVDALEYYEDRYLPLDTDNVSLVQNGPGAYGMGSDSVVLLADGLVTGMNNPIPGLFSRIVHYLLAHELGHFYFGIGTPPDFLRENFLSEGMNEWSTLRYLESEYGVWNTRLDPDHPDLFASLLNDILFATDSMRATMIQSTSANRLAGMDYPLSSEPEARILNAASVVDYSVGAFTVGMLAAYCGGESFDEAIAAYLRANFHRPVDSTTLRRFLEVYYGIDLSPFFDAFVTANGSVDFRLDGTLNEATGDGRYRSVLTLTDEGDSGVFVPPVVRVYFEDGTTGDYRPQGPGQLVVESPLPVRCAGVDPDAVLLDYGRMNNFTPRQVVASWSGNDQLQTGQALRIFPDYYFDTDLFGYVSFGFGLGIENPLRFRTSLVPFSTLTLAPASPPRSPLGALLRFDLRLPRNQALSADLAYGFPDRIESASVAYSGSLSGTAELGYRARYLYPYLGYSLQTGVYNLSLATAGSPFLLSTAGVSLDTIISTGLFASVTDAWLFRFADASMENKIALNLGAILLPFRRVLVGLEAGASAVYGPAGISGLGLINTLPGLPAADDTPHRYGLSGGVSLVLPLLNGISLRMLNLIILQSINLAFVYRTGSVFDESSELLPAFRHSVGFELIPTIRTVLDMSLSLGLGLAWDVGSVAAALADPSVPLTPLIPGFYIDLDNPAVQYYGSYQAF